MYSLMMDQTLEAGSCPSETSSIINAGTHPPPPPSGKDVLMQYNTTYHSQLVLRVQDQKEAVQLDLYNHDDIVNQELNLIDNLDMEDQESMHTSSVTISQPPPPDDQPRVFSCNYCQRKFYSSQALGGHQNAHKRERTIAKRGQRSMMAAATAFGHAYLQPHHHLSSILHGGAAYRSLGIQAHSMILQKPQNSTGHHQNWSSRQTMPPAVAGKLISMETAANQATSTGSSSRLFHSGRSFETAIDRHLRPTDHIIGGCWWPPAAGGGISLIIKPDQEDQLQKLDLSLKL